MPDCSLETHSKRKPIKKIRQPNEKATMKRGFFLKLVAGAGFEPTTFGL
jgi:hypothetical protein